MPMIRFQVRRVIADADLDSPAGRDGALEKAAGLIAEHTREGSATRGELVRHVADRLDMPEIHVHGAIAPGAARPAAAAPKPALPAGSSAGEVAFRAEREFLSRCLASAELGRGYLCRPTDEQLSSDATRRARTHLAENFDDPLAGLPEDEPALAALVTDVVHAALDQPPSTEALLQMSILQLETRRIDREIRRAAQAGDHPRQSELAKAEQRVRVELDQLVGQMA